MSAGAAPRIRWTDPRLRDAWLIALALLLVWAASWPRLMINGDEYLYAGEARTLLHGRVVPIDGDPLPAPLHAPGSVLRYPLGWPLLLAPLALAGFRALFALPCLFHLAGVLLFARLLVRRGLPAWNCLAWALWLPALPFARTLMTDVPTATLFLLVLDAWEEDRPALAGLAMALSLSFRLAAIFPAAGLGLAALLEDRKKALRCLGGGAAAGVASVLLGNQLMHDDPLRSPYSENGLQLLGAHRLGAHALLYLAGLLVFPPFPLAAWLRAPRRCDRWLLACAPALLFAIVYDYQDQSPSLLETLVGGQRFMLPAHAVLLASTSPVWALRGFPRARLFAAPAAAAVFAASIHFTRPLYDRYAPAVERLRACHPASIAYNTSASRIALSVDAARYRLADARDPRGLAEVAVFATRAPTHQVAQSIFVQPLPASLAAEPCARAGEFYLFDLGGRCLAPESACEGFTRR